MKKNNKGFTLAELLIVVAIIAVLVAIAIPVFTTQQERSREATDIANVRSAYANCIAAYITDGEAHSMSITAKQAQNGWQGESGVLMTQIDGVEGSVDIPELNGAATYTVTVQDSGSTTAVDVTHP